MNTERPWMTALEMQFAAMGFADVFMERTDHLSPKYKKYEKTYAMARGPLRRAAAYAWSNETYNAVAMAAKTIPLDTTLLGATLPEPECWWWLGDTPYVMPWGSDLFSVVALLMFKGHMISGEQNAVGFVTFSKPLSENVPPVPSTYWTWRHGESYHDVMKRLDALREGDDQTACHARHLGRFAVAGLQWINQRILSTSFGQVERHRRKQLAREHNTPLPADVKVIQLRRTESQSRPPSSSNEDVDWSCRWVVNGHWRNQPYKDERKLIYIMPYVKGPDDKPLKVPTHTVYQVSR